ncbi:Exosome complex protein [Escovopsis weberi]|uniref:Exosome complex protein n=1 Tax=Escovopsis weberi TaxID=150374 RepID=A0A0M8N2N8_ESCWE|nr:Exosome complex protein [Escovopsis weberi]
MTDVKNIVPDLERLDSQLDDLEDALEPLLKNLDGMASELPLLDKAKLYSLTAYAIESLLFSSVKLQGADAQNHAVFTELKRVQQYFGKIKKVEEPEAQRSLTVDKEATARILKSNLTLSAKLAEKIAEERAKALLRSVEKTEKKKRPAEDSAQSAASASSNQGGGVSKKAKHKGKNKKKGSK